MSLLSLVEANLPPGFRFHPRDDELICDYVAPKVAGDGSRSFFGCQMMIEVDLNKCEPWDLPEMALVGGKDWYLFSLKDRKYATGQRANRATPSGYWKATGVDKTVVRKGLLVGMRKTLVFYKGRAPKGRKTEWVMHEFRMEPPPHPSKPSLEEDWVLCRIFNKSRGISAKPSTKTTYDDTGSSSLPLLADTYITFNQTLPNLEGFQQVPCFSSFSPSQKERSQPTKSLTHLGVSPERGSCLSPLSSDKKVITKFWNHRERPQSLAQEGSESFVSETGLPSVWNPY